MPVKTHPIIAAQWDSSQTLEQNYRRLGLTAKLGKRAGGVEKIIDFEKLAQSDSDDDEDEFQEAQEHLPLASGEGRIVKLADGSVKIEYGSEESSTVADNTTTSTEQPTEVVQQLEELAAARVSNPRVQSEREQDWIAQLVSKHGDDYRAMFLDKKLNKFQQTEGELKRKIRKWHQTNSA